MPKTSRPADPKGKIDYLGAVLLIVATVTLISCIDHRVMETLAPPLRAALLLGFVVSFAGFIYREWTAPSPILDLSLFRIRMFSLSGLALLLASIAAPAGTSIAQTPAIPAPAVIHATPALWQVSDADTTIYLFGTFHTLDGRTAWLDNRVRQAFDGSDELVLETVVPANQFAMQAAAERQVTETSTDGRRKLKPFFAGTQQAMSQGRTIGLSVEHGADAVLLRLLRGQQRTLHQRSPRQHHDVVAIALDGRTAERNHVVRAGIFAFVVRLPIEVLVLQEEHRVVAPDCRPQQSRGVLSVRGERDSDSRAMRKNTFA